MERHGILSILLAADAEPLHGLLAESMIRLHCYNNEGSLQAETFLLRFTVWFMVTMRDFLLADVEKVLIFIRPIFIWRFKVISFNMYVNSLYERAIPYEWQTDISMSLPHTKECRSFTHWFRSLECLWPHSSLSEFHFGLLPPPPLSPLGMNGQPVNRLSDLRRIHRLSSRNVDVDE